MQILTGSFENIENAYITYNGDITNQLTIVNDGVESQVEDTSGGEAAVFTLYYNENDYNYDVPFESVTSQVQDLDNWDTASEEAIINYVQENDPRFTNLKLL